MIPDDLDARIRQILTSTGMILGGIILVGTSCVADVDCAYGDPSCDDAGVMAVIAGLRPPLFLVGTGNGTIYASTDNGSEWEAMQLSDSGFLVQGFGEANGNIFAFGSDSGGMPAFYVMQRTGQWSGPYSVPLSSELTYGSGNGSSVYTIGADFQIVSLLPDGNYQFINTPTMVGPTTMLQNAGAYWFLGDNAGSADRVRYSLDGGSWTQATPGITDEPIRDVALLGTTYIVVGQGAATTFYTISGSLANWTNGTGIPASSNVCISGDVAVAGTDAGDVHRTADGITYNAAVNIGLSGNLEGLACNGTTIVAIPQIAGSWSISRDAGATWTSLTDPTGAGHTPLSIEYFP
ncbi:MAG TPA: hypothetical protein DEA96_14695 [Leptospiraceae bacterium]|nr:hypothetical protein [Spirochaetaceae bacterium]HBS06214.1 hypothetical protein [Leptospiraceae bacterium]|tara:strand:- start:39470 stop:40519 length:1050 start_codon:yes stop_codon:yes gene_type:complete